MRLFDKFKGKIDKKYVEFSTYGGNNYYLNEKSDAIKMYEAYNLNAVFNSCVKRICNQLNTVPIGLYQGEREIKNHKILNLLQRPNLEEGKNEFFFKLAAFLLITGNSFVEMKFRDPRRSEPSEGEPVFLDVLLPQNVDICAVDDKVTGYRIVEGARQYDVKIGIRNGNLICNVIHFSQFNPINNIRGVGALLPAWLTVEQHNKGVLWNTSLFNNSARPKGILKITEDLTQDQMNMLKHDFDALYSGAINADRTPLFPKGIDFESTGMSPADMEFLQGLEFSGKMICSALGVPVDLIFGQSTYENLQTANEQMAENTTIPLINHIISELNRTLVKRYGDNLELRADVHAMPALSDKKDRLRVSLETTSFLTINEKREMLGYSPVDGGDTLFVEFGKIPLDSAADMTQNANPVDTSQQLKKMGYDENETKKMIDIIYGKIN